MAALRTALLAACLAAALALSSAAAVKPASKCATTPDTPLMGGWSATQDVPKAAFEAIQVALVESASGNSTWVPCDDPIIDLQQACTQVVAGQQVEVVAALDCPEVPSSVTVHSVVYLPVGANAEPEVKELEVLSVDGEELAAPEVVVAA